MLVVRSVDCFEHEGHYCEIMPQPSKPYVEFSPKLDKIPPMPEAERIEGIAFISGRAAASGQNPVIRVGFSQQVAEKLGFLLDIAIHPHREIKALRDHCTSLSTALADVQKNYEDALRDVHRNLVMAEQARTRVEADYPKACEALQRASRLPFLKRLRFLLGWPLGNLVETQSDPKDRSHHDTPTETDAAAASNSRTATNP